MPYQELIKCIKKVSTLGSIGGLLGWDQETMMPPKGIKLRTEEKTLVASLTHEWFTDDKVGKLIEEAKKQSLTEEQQANVREIEWGYKRSKAIPAKWVEDFERATTEGVEIWREARKKKDFALFKPHLRKIIKLSQEYARLIDPKRPPYEVLVESFERGIPFEDIVKFFDQLKQELPPLIKSINSDTDASITKYHIPLDKQKDFAKELAAYAGYDFSKGRLDESTHPFTGYYGRITTRYEDNWVSTIMSTIHESGHGMYEHGLPDEHFGEPIGEAGSFSLHEGMSRFWENNIGRSLPFWKGIFPKMKAKYGLPLDVEQFYRIINRVEPGFIRVDADELTYTMHIILRFEIEKELIEGTLKLDELPKAWNSKMEKHLGITPSDDGVGCLQDTHWAGGMFGYFPCYSLGSMIAAQLFAAAKKDLPKLEEELAAGNLESMQAWLQDKVYSKGQLYRTSEHIKIATGKDFSPEDYLSYLKNKFG